MKVRLAYRDRDLDLLAPPPKNVDDLAQDLGLEIVYAAMAGGDGYLLDIARKTLVLGLDDPDAIRYRQAVLSDCLDHPDAVRQLYGLAVEAIEGERRVWGYATSRMPETLLHRSTDVMEVMGGMLRRLRSIADEQGERFRSDAFRRLFDEIHRELDDAYLATVAQHVERLRFRDGVVVSATLGDGNRGEAYTLRRRVKPRTWRERIGLTEPDSYTWDLPERDEAGAQALGELRARGIALAAVTLAQSADHVLSYFVQLRAELGFFIGCLNLHAHLTQRDQPVCLPEPEPPGSPRLAARGLYDAALSLSSRERVIGSDIDADGTTLLMITGPNRGGKSTFLRSLGLAQLMMQAGMFVPARSFRADIRPEVFTHFRREEEADLRRGKFDEELARMSAIVDLVTPTSLLLCNESFASTNEREGSEVARQVVRALLEGDVKVAYVTHMFDLASGFHAERGEDALFLRAERLPDGRRTFRLVEGEPLPTSHGEDIYRRIFGPDGGEGRADPGEVARSA